MKVWDILKKVGKRAIRDAVPGAALIIDMVNGFLPDKSVLTTSSTGDQISHAIESLPSEQQAELFAKKYDVEIEEIKQEGETLRAMLAADAKSTHTTRPYIAKHSFHVLALITVMIMVGWMVAVFKSDDPLSAITGGWQLVLALLVPFVALLRAYFGMLSREHKNRLDSAHGATTPAGIAGILSTLLKR